MLRIGKHCDFCSQNDFLPFTCTVCHKICCSDHKETHPCVSTPNLPATGRERTKLSPPRIHRELNLGARPNGPDPVKQSALEKLRSYMATREPKFLGKTKPDKSQPVNAKESKLNAVGDNSIPVGNRHYMHIRRAPATTKDEISGETITRSELVVFVFYDKTKPIGTALDKAKKTLNFSAASKFWLGNNELPLGSPIAGIPPESTLTLA